MLVSAFVREGNGLTALERGASGYLCSEGQVVVLQTRTTELPTVTLCGERLSILSLRRDGEEFVAEFERWIDTWAGRTRFVVQAGPSTEVVELDIGPPGRKLGPGAWEALIQELSEISSSLPWGSAPGAAPGRPMPDALVTVHPAIIEHELPVFQRLLRQLLADPPTLTRRIRAIRPLDGSRGADLRTIQWLSRRPLELAGLRGMSVDGQAPNNRALADQPATQTSFDHPVTRYVAHLLEQIYRRLSATAALLRSSSGKDPSATCYAVQLAVDVERARDAVAALQRAPLFRAVKAEPVSDSVLQSLPDHPLYSGIHRVGRRLLDPGLAYAPGQDVYSALKHSYDLFELVVLYRLIGAIDVELGHDWQRIRSASVHRLPLEDRPKDRSIWSWKGPEGQVLSLFYQASFGSARPPPDQRKFHSLSGARIPDYILILETESAETWIVLDAKYRSSQQAVQEGLGDIHRYRDSLRVGGKRASAAYVIVPKLHGEAELYGQGEFLEAHKLGALEVGKATWAAPIWTWLWSATGNQLIQSSTPHVL